MIARQLFAYLCLLGKKWILWLSSALDIAGAILVYRIYPQQELPQPVYWILPIIGLLWANFQIYRDLAAPLDDRLRSVAEHEITQNLKALNGYLEKVNQLSESLGDPAQKRLVLARKAIELSLPTLSYTIWETQTSLLTKAFSTEQFQQVQDFYSRLEEFSDHYRKLQALMEEQQANLRAGRAPDGGATQMGVPAGPGVFDKNAPVLWESLETIARTLIAEGNPLERRDYQLAA